MTNNSSNREQILNQPAYWVENINAFLYDAIVGYMEDNNLNQKQLAKHLDLSTGRVSQILNDGEINYSIEKIVEIALKVGKFPNFKFENKEAYLAKEKKEVLKKYTEFIFSNIFNNTFKESEPKEAKIISIKTKPSTQSFQMTLNYG